MKIKFDKVNFDLLIKTIKIIVIILLGILFVSINFFQVIYIIDTLDLSDGSKAILSFISMFLLYYFYYFIINIMWNLLLKYIITRYYPINKKTENCIFLRSVLSLKRYFDNGGRKNEYLYIILTNDVENFSNMCDQTITEINYFIEHIEPKINLFLIKIYL